MCMSDNVSTFILGCNHPSQRSQRMKNTVSTVVDLILMTVKPGNRNGLDVTTAGDGFTTGVSAWQRCLKKRRNGSAQSACDSYFI